MLYRSSLTILAAVVLAGCSAKPNARAAVKKDSTGQAANGDVARSASDTGAPAATTAATAEKPPGKPGDTTNARLIPGRKKMDSTSFMSAIRAGSRMMPKWPTPTTEAGALLPKNRIVGVGHFGIMRGPARIADMND